jgi:hypothetical protein
MLFPARLGQAVFFAGRSDQIRIEAHNLKIEFTGGGILVCVVKIELVFSCGVNDAGHIVRLQSNQPHRAIDQDVLHETGERLSFAEFQQNDPDGVQREVGEKESIV